jgi:lipid-A-disaccharide synthase
LRYDPADLFFVAGEASGDLQASLIARTAQRQRPGITIAACGGARLRAAGARIVVDSSELASIGPLSVIPRVPLLYAILRWLDVAIRKRPPGLYVAVDAGAFNLRLIRRLRRAGYRAPIVYYFPPGAWLDDIEQARTVAGMALPLTPFAHQRDFYRDLGLRIEHFGHPLVSVIAKRPPRPVRAQPLIAVLPGSRAEEAARHTAILAHAARELARTTSASFVAIATTDRRARQIQTLWERAGGPSGFKISRNDATTVLALADLAWVASGTAVLEAALVGVPQVVFYVVSQAQFRLAKRWLPPALLSSIALPNLVMQRRIVPELLQGEFTADRLHEETNTLLEQDEVRERMLLEYEELRIALGPPDSLQRNAAYVVEQMERAKTP